LPVRLARCHIPRSTGEATVTGTLRCPDCGHPNPAGAAACEACGFPLAEHSQEALHAAPEASSPAPQALPPIPRPRRRRPPRGSNEALSLWLVFGTIMALVVIYFAVKSNVDRSQPPVEGASPVQQENADSLRLVLEKDSTDVHAQVHLGDLLYDTGNWTEAIVHYRAAIRRDSSLVNALVDLGVCYYNLGAAADAKRHFELALRRDPHQPVALFNLGIVYEGMNDTKLALDFYHRALRTEPPDEMKQAILQAMSRVQKKAGVQPKPLGG
jgi:tetratricopeptide (TPR) repeat protein